MGDAFLRMSDDEPEEPPLPYGIPYPPALPNKISVERRNGRRHEIDPNWLRHAAQFGARDDPGGQGFQIRPFSRDDPTGNGARFPGDWDVQHRLGAPSPLHTWTYVISKWGLQVLDKAGFLNLDLDLPDSMLSIQGRYFPKRPAGWRDDTIHPALRKDMWRDIADNEYLMLKPAVLLASALLDDPGTMCLFHALATPSCHVTFQDPTLGECKRIHVPDSLTGAEQVSTFRKMCDMRQWTYIYWEDVSILDREDALAFTQRLRPLVTASGPHTSQSKIALSRYYLEAMEGWVTRNVNNHYRYYFRNVLNTAGVPPERKPEHFEDKLDSVPLRTSFLFGLILVHELTHAFAMAYFPVPGEKTYPEPWVEDNRYSEIGHAMMQHIFNGIPRANVFEPFGSSGSKWRMFTHAPFGIYFAETWEKWAEPGRESMQIVQGVRAAYQSPIVNFPLPARQLFDYFTRHMWVTNVPRYGLAALEFVRTPEWASNRMPSPRDADPMNMSTLR